MPATGKPHDSSRHALLAGGGSAGHVFPALALAEELERREWTVSLVGRAGQMEERLALGAGATFHALPAAPIVGTSWTQKARTTATTLRSAWAGRRLVRRTGAAVVVGMGGYVSVPAVLGARLSGRPALLFEPNAVAGMANRWLSRWADEAAVAYPAAAGALACPAHETGTPVRAAFGRQPVTAPGEEPRLLVLGGSQGARRLNELVPAALGKLPGGSPLPHVLHQAGAGNSQVTREAYERAGVEAVRAEVVEFLDDVAGALGRSHLVVSRAGAITLAELCAVGRPAVLAPLELAGGHQADNAAALVEAGAAEIFPSGAGAGELAAVLDELLRDRERLEAMGHAARGLGRSDAAGRLADRVVALGGGG